MVKQIPEKFKKIFSVFGKDVDMINGPLFGRLWIYVIPLMLSGMLQLVYNAADVAVVGNFAADSKNCLAAVGSTGAITNLIIGLFLGLSVGTNVVISRYLVAGDDKNTSEAVHTAILTSLIFGAVLSVAGVFLAMPVLRMMDTPDSVINLSTMYMQIYFLGMPASMLYNFGSAILRSKGDTRYPFLVLFLSGLVNLTLNLITVIVFHLDVAGVAIATVSSQICSATLIVLRLTRMKDCCRLNLRKLRIYPDKLMKIARIGLPAGVQSIMFSLSNVIIQSGVNSLGPEAMAGNTAASNVDGFIYIACNSVYHATVAFTGQNYGARKYARIKKIALQAMIIVAIIGLVLGGIVMLFDDFFLEIYAPGEENILAREYGALRLKVMAPTYFLCGMMEVSTALMRGMGSSVIPMCITVVGTCIFRVWWVLCIFKPIEYFHNMDWLYFTYPISWIVTMSAIMIAFGLLFKSKCRKRGLDPKHLPE